MTNTITTTTTDLRVIRRALQFIPAGEQITVENLMPALEAAQVRPNAYGGLLRAACLRGWLTTDGRTTPAQHAAARGRRVLIYTVTSVPKAVAA